jgi:hemolysin activation/secretion protein
MSLCPVSESASFSRAVLLCFASFLAMSGLSAQALAAVAPPPSATTATAEAATLASRFFIQEFKVEGVHSVNSDDVEEAVYPFLGPERTTDDVEKARAAVEKLYRSKGYQAAFAQIPAQDASNGVVTIQVSEGVVGRTRVRGSQYTSPGQLKRLAPAMAEGKALNFNEVGKDVARLNQVPDRRVTPDFKSGVEPGTIDVDLKVEEKKLPVAANIELNNRNSPNTSDLRLNGGVSYANLFQLGHTFGLSFQIAPEELNDAKVFSGYYIFRPAGSDMITLQVLATKQDSDVSTLGGGAVAGRGETYALKSIFTLPGSDSFYQTLSAGFDLKKLNQDLRTGDSVSRAPIRYTTLSANYGITWLGKHGSTELSLTPTLGLRGMGSDDAEFDTRRFAASANFSYLRGELARTQKLPYDIQLMLRSQAQYTDQPLVDSEQFSAGGMDTVRGYFESEVAGDQAISVAAELSSPSLFTLLDRKSWGEWRVHAFAESAWVKLQTPLPAQASSFNPIGVGFGTRFKVKNHFSGSIDAGWPLHAEGQTQVGDLRVNFSLGAQY